MHTRLRPARPKLGLRPQPAKPLGDVTQGPLRYPQSTSVDYYWGKILI